MNSLRIVLPGVPPSLNTVAGRKNVWEYRRMKKLWTEAVYASCLGMRPIKPWPRSMVTVTYYFPDRRRRDPDNFAPKFLMDGLTKAGVIKDDSFDCVTLTLRGEVDKKNPRTEIIITNMEE